MVSVLRSWKGHDFFFEAADLILQKYPDVRFLIVGDGPRKADLERIIKEKNLSEAVLMLGYRNCITAIMNFLDLLFHSLNAKIRKLQSVNNW